MTADWHYLGMDLSISDLDTENLEYFRYCALHDFRLQECLACRMIRYPPTTACPWCADRRSSWSRVEGRGTVYSYTEVHHAIQPGFRSHTPYLVLLVELETQRGEPTADEAIRMIGNLTTPAGALVPPDVVAQVGIGTRVRMTYSDIGPGLALPQWTVDMSASQPAVPWRYGEAS